MASVVIHPKVESGVIDNSLLSKCVLKQGPTGEAGRLFAQEGVNLNEVTSLRLEFRNIVRIDHLWMMTSLTVLSLYNNYIEKIENLDQLVNLKELNLSYNLIGKIEGLNTLNNIEILILSYNQIERIDNFEELEKLVVLGLAGNKISDFSEVIYLRQFKELRGLSFKENPCCIHPEADGFLKAFLPQVTHIDYAIISEKERAKFVDDYFVALKKLNKADKIKKDAILRRQQYETEKEFLAISFVDYLNGPELLQGMFEADPDGMLLLKAGIKIKALHEKYTSTYVELMKNLVQYGAEQHYKRKKEIDVFEEVVKDVREKSINNSKDIVAQFAEVKDDLLESLAIYIESVLSEVSTLTDVKDSIFSLCDGFKDIVKKSWKSLMREETVLYEQFEETRIKFAANIKELANEMINATREHFGEWREHEQTWMDDLSKTLKEINADLVATFDDMPKLQEILSEPSNLVDVLAQSIDVHVRYIDDKEDYFITKMKQWREEIVQKLNADEIKRNRSRVLEISHYIENQHKQLKNAVTILFIDGILPPNFEEVLNTQVEEDVVQVIKKKSISFDADDDDYQ